jgi:hypothetical protein
MMNSQKPFVFVLMPFDASFDDVYKLGIKETAESLSAYCERVDEQIFEERMLDRIYNQINKADFIVADLTGRNPNVFYEVGYAHALNKKVVLLTSNVADIPFDLRHHYHIVYEGKILKLKEELRRRLDWHFRNPNQIEQTTDDAIQLFIDGNLIEEDKIIEIERKGGYVAGAYQFDLKIDIHNNSKELFNNPFYIGIITEYFDGAGDHSIRELNDYVSRNNINPQVTKLDDGTYLHLSEKRNGLYPESWENFIVKMYTATRYYNITMPMKVKIYTAFRSREIPFRLLVQVKPERHL